MCILMLYTVCRYVSIYYMQTFVEQQQLTHTHRQAGRQASLVQFSWPPFEAASRRRENHGGPGDRYVRPLIGWSRSHWSPGWPVWVWGCRCDGRPVGSGGSVCSAAGSPGTGGKNDAPSPPPGVRNPLLLPLQSQRRWQAVSWSEPLVIGGSDSCPSLDPLGQAVAGGTPPLLRP